MKKIQFLFVIMVLVMLPCLSACSGDDDPSTQELAFEKLSGSWDLSSGGSVMVDGQNASLNFAGFSFSFTEGAYATINAGDLFKATGVWTWVDQDAQRISIDDGKAITIVSLTEQQFVFSFTFNGTGGVANSGDGIAGNYTITVTKP